MCFGDRPGELRDAHVVLRFHPDTLAEDSRGVQGESSTRAAAPALAAPANLGDAVPTESALPAATDNGPVAAYRPIDHGWSMAAFRATHVDNPQEVLREAQVETFAGLSDLTTALAEMMAQQDSNAWILPRIFSDRPGVNWYNSRFDITRQIAAVVNDAFLANRAPALFGSGTPLTMRLPGRLYGTSGTLHLGLEVVTAQPAEQTATEMRSRQFTASHGGTRGGSSMTTGYMHAAWGQLAGFLGSPDSHNSLGGILGVDFIANVRQGATDGGPRAYHRGGDKRSGRIYVPIHLRVRWHAIFTPETAGRSVRPGEVRYRDYEPPAHQPTVVWLPEETVPAFMAAIRYGPEKP